MLRMSKMADYAALMLATMAEQPQSHHTAAELAEVTGISPPTVSKLLKTLGHADLLTSRRGAHGGYSLARDPATISAVDVIEAIEGPMAVTECTVSPGSCDLEPTCQLSSQWQLLSVAVRRALAEITLKDLIGDPIAPHIAVHRPATVKFPDSLESKHGNA
jgi:FeS assembly SUF system regulator